MSDPPHISRNSPSIVTRTVTNINEFIKWNQKISEDFGLRSSTLLPWYRGHGNDSNRLKPSIYRCEIEKDLERELIREFKIRATDHLPPTHRTPIDWLFIAQHYGIPTRLLDWSENPLVALFFATNNQTTRTDAHVWALNAWELNKSTGQGQSVPTTDSDLFKKYVIDIDDPDVPRTITATEPMAIRPYHIFPRLNAQSGVFTIHGSNEKALDTSPFVRRNRAACLQKAIIPNDVKFRIKKSLYQLGIHDTSLFPDLDGVARAMRFRLSRSYFSGRP